MPKDQIKTKFQEAWLSLPQFSPWLTKAVSIYDGYCKLCKKNIDIGNMGVAGLKSHANGKQHKEYLATSTGNMGTVQLTKFFIPTTVSQITVKVSSSLVSSCSSAHQQTSDTIPACSSAPSCSSAMQQTAQTIPSAPQSTSKVSSMLVKDTVVKAEILWALQVVQSHFSYNSCDHLAETFSAMFTDSDIAKQFSLGRDKVSYTIAYGLAPFFHQELVDLIKTCDYFVIAFDESLNKSIQEKQMDIHVRYWDTSSNFVCTRYFKSAFLGHATANDMMVKFLDCLKLIDLKKMVQLSMDGPNVNWKFYDDLCKHVAEDPNDPKTVNIGSCGLHRMHLAYRAGVESSKWGIGSILSSLWYLFHDSPARREDFILLTSAKLMPLKFCSHRWVENSIVLQRAIDIWPNILLYIQSFKTGDKQKNKPSINSFCVIEKAADDVYTLAEFHFLLSVANQIEPYLKQFQSDTPMLPFVFEVMIKALKELLSRFMKKSFLLQESDIWSIDPTVVENHCPWREVDCYWVCCKNVSAVTS